MRNNYSDETKAAVMASLLQGQSVNKVAADYNVPIGTIKSWKNRYEQASETKVATSEVVATQKRDIAEMVIDLLHSHMEAAIKIANSITPEYIVKQDASEIAVLLGVINDKAFRMLEALGRATSDDNPTEN